MLFKLQVIMAHILQCFIRICLIRTETRETQGTCKSFKFKKHNQSDMIKVCFLVPDLNKYRSIILINLKIV